MFTPGASRVVLLPTLDTGVLILFTSFKGRPYQKQNGTVRFLTTDTV